MTWNGRQRKSGSLTLSTGLAWHAASDIRPIDVRCVAGILPVWSKQLTLIWLDSRFIQPEFSFANMVLGEESGMVRIRPSVLFSHWINVSVVSILDGEQWISRWHRIKVRSFSRFSI